MSDNGAQPRRPGQFYPGDPRIGRKPGSKNKVTVEVRELAQRLVNDPVYLANLQQRLQDGKAGVMEETLWHYAYGQPSKAEPVNDATGSVGRVLRVVNG